MMAPNVSNSVYPRFPLEIWQIILRFATLVSNALDTHAPDPFTYPGPLTQDELRVHLRKSLFTKRSVVLVCKAWNEIGTCFLYEAISVSRSFKVWIRRLEDAPAARIPEYRRRKGRWVLRLDMPSVSDEPGVGQLLDFIKLMELLPNVSIIAMRPKRPVKWEGESESAPLILPIRPIPFSSLRVLDLPTYPPEFPVTYTHSYRYTPSLRRLCTKPDPTYQWHGRKVVGPNLEYLKLQGGISIFSVIGEGPLPPSLTYLGFEVEAARMDKIITGEVTLPGQYLTTIELDDYDALQCISYRPPAFSRRIFAEFLRKIAETCPNLRNLVLNIRCSGEDVISSYLPPVEKLGIHFHAKRCAGLHKMVQRFVSVTPSIRIVRILGNPAYADLVARSTKTFESFREMSSVLMTEYEVRYEDRTGRLFHD